MVNLALLLVFCASILITDTHAAPTVYPELIPGPGMPSLASLNLTSEMLYKQALASQISPPQGSSDQARALSSSFYDDLCQSSDVGSLVNAQMCYQYLVSVGDTTCTVGDASPGAHSNQYGAQRQLARVLDTGCGFPERV